MVIVTTCRNRESAAGVNMVPASFVEDMADPGVPPDALKAVPSG